MKFCECGGLLVPQKEGRKVSFKCRDCGKILDNIRDKYKFSEKVDEKKDVVVIEDENADLPKTTTVCPKCGHTEAVWWVQQTRSGDEPPTTFLKCTKCRYSWRDYG